MISLEFMFCSYFVYLFNYTYRFIFRKVRKTSVTWVLVSLCTSMLIFNLLFVTGIENKNKDKNSTDENNEIPQKIPPNRLCTAVAILLHYFLLAMFTWTGVSAVQLYFLLIRTMKPLPQRFTLYMSLIGWGKRLLLYLPRNLILLKLFIYFVTILIYWGDMGYTGFRCTIL